MLRIGTSVHDHKVDMNLWKKFKIKTTLVNKLGKINIFWHKSSDKSTILKKQEKNKHFKVKTSFHKKVHVSKICQECLLRIAKIGA